LKPERWGITFGSRGEPPQNHRENTRATYRESRSQGTTENSHIGHRAHASESTGLTVKVRNIQYEIILHVTQILITE
jgi:hypothetical protein